MTIQLHELEDAIMELPQHLQVWIDQTTGFVYFNNEEGSEPGVLCQVALKDIDEALELCLK